MNIKLFNIEEYSASRFILGKVKPLVFISHVMPQGFTKLKLFCSQPFKDLLPMLN